MANYFFPKSVFIITFFALFLSYPAISQEKANQLKKWNLPLTVNDLNAKIDFQVDSTWVLVEGSTSAIKGSVSYKLNSAETIISELSLPVANLKTGLEMRDHHLYEIIAADKFPEIKLILTASDAACNPSILEKVDHCDFIQKGQISIRGISREITLQSVIKKTQSGYIANGEITFPWAAFEIEDPSNFFAKLRPDVTISYSLNIPQ